MYSRLARILFFLFALIVLSAIFLIFQIYRSFPKTRGEILCKGLTGPVDVYRDSFGVPHIYAATQHDLFFAQGYIHAQDRFWQMDVWRHTGSGRLSEMFGESQIETDKFLRTMGWARVAQKELDISDPNSVAILKSYADGVNAYLANHSGTALSLEYGALRVLSPQYQPERWRPVDSLIWGKVMAWDLGSNIDFEIYRSVLLKSLTAEQIDELFPGYSTDHPLILQQAGPISVGRASLPARPDQITALEHTAGALKKLGRRFPEDTIGSNNWVIAGRLTSTGKPFLCNDPHLGLQMPSIWYQVALRCNPVGADCPFEVAGFSFAGVPGIIIGHNNRIAWGFTNVGPDTMDLYIEKLNSQNPNQYEVNGRWADMQLIPETIRVAKGKPVSWTVRHTRHGPVLSDTYSALKNLQPGKALKNSEPYAVALRWTALEPYSTFPAIWKANLARNWGEFRAALSHFDLPSQNSVYADIDGNIGYQMPGKIPIRAAGDGRYPVPGWTEEYEWTGYIPFEELPSVLNPQQGYVATANNAVIGSQFPYLITHDWDYGFRAKRIVEMIETRKEPIHLEFLQKMQGDNKNLNAETLVPVLLKVPLKDKDLEKKRGLLRDWDFQNAMDSAPAALFEAFWKRLLAETFHDDLPQDYWPGGGSRWMEVIRRLVKDPQNKWWDNQTTSSIETRDPIFARAFSQAVGELGKKFGPDPSQWSWGRLHTAIFRNGTLGKSGIRAMEFIFNRGPFPSSGGNAIVNATGWDASQSFEVVDVPSMRMIADLSNLANSRTIHTTGQSGHAFHRHYIDMADSWRNVEYQPMLWERSQVDHNSKEHLRLVP